MPPHRVVVADDSDVFRTALCDFLRRVPNLSVVATAFDGKEAIAYVVELKPELLILDINMPVMNGWEVLHELRRQKIPVCTLVLTAHSSQVLKQRALDNGADAWVPKGNIPLLVDTLRDLLANQADR